MVSISVGSVSVRVVPSTNGFTEQLRRDIVPGADGVGRSVGEGIARGLGNPLEGPLNESARQQQRRAPRQGDDVAGAFARGFQARLKAAFKALPKAEIDADSSPADRKIAALRARLAELSEKTIGVDMDSTEALAELAVIKAELADVGRDATVNVRADTAAAAAQLSAVQAEVNRLDGRTARVNVDTSAATASIGSLGVAMAGVAAIPVAATVGAGIAGLVGPLGAAGAGFGGLAAVAVPAISSIKQALAAEKTAQTAASVAAGQGQARTLAMAGAQQQLASAVRNASFAHAQALDQVRSAQQQLTQSQVSAATAQRALNQAEADARRNLQDLANNVADAKLAERQATFDLTDAQTAYNKVANDPASSKDQIARAKLTLDQARQGLTEQQEMLKRLQADEKAAAKAGVNGSNQVTQARQQLAQANLQVTNSERSLAQARAGVARSDQQAADQVATARRGVTQASLAASSATAKLGLAMAALTPAERGLAHDWKALTGVYKDWSKALEPAVLPALSGGIALVTSQLPKLNGLIRGSSLGMQVLERDAQAALGGKFWTDFVDNIGKEAPVAIIGLGHIAGDVFTGIAGVVQAVLPFTSTLLGSVEHLTGGFATWGKQLGTSSEFGQFFAFVSKEGPVIVHDLESVGGAFISIAKALAPLGALQLAILGPVADGISAIAKNSPGLLQVAVAIYAVNKATKTLQLVGIARGFLGVAVAEGTAATGATTLGLRMRTLGASMMGAERSAVSTRTALLGLSKAAGAIGGILIASEAVGALVNSQYGAVASTDDLTKSLIDLGKTGKASGAFATEWRGGALSGKTALEEFGQAAKEIGNPSFGDYISHGLDKAFSFIPGISFQFGKLQERMTSTDTALAAMVKSGNLTGANQAFGQLAIQAGKSGIGVDELRKLFPHYSAVVGDAAIKVAILNNNMSINAHRFADSQREVIDFNTSLQTASGLLSINGKAFFGNSQQALANRGSVLQTAGILQDYSDNLTTNGLVTVDNMKKMRGQRDALIKVAEKFGLSKKAATDYVDKLVTIPDQVSTAITVHATGKYDFPGHINPFFIGPTLPGHAAGGLVQGSGGPRADSLVTRISPGEFVVNAPATRANLPLLAAINDAGNAGTGYRGQGYAGGGLVRPEVMRPHNLPAFAGGGLVKPTPGADYRYSYAGDAAKSLASATAGIDRGMQAIGTAAVNQTAAIGGALLGLIQGSGNGGKAVQFARAQLGEPYVWGATGPNSWDCSGLTHAAWKAAGKEIGRTTYQQINAGRAGSRAQALPGDLHLPEAGHVMMFNQKGGTGGNQEMIHAPHTGDHVRYAPFRGGGWVRLIASPGGGSGGGSTQSVSAAKSYARGQLGEFGWSASQFSPLESLWNRESGWRWNAKNKSSGAYGIPQSLPASKMRSAGSDYLTNALTQIRWGLGYIDGRYGNPSKAFRHEANVGWYDQGGFLPPGLSTVYNGTGGPEPVLTSKQWDAMAVGNSHTAEYHAHFDGLTAQSIQGEVRTAFHAMEVSNAIKHRIGRRR